MTSIEQLQICGIRSFNPNPAHKQTVHFHKPLTVILGKNGAGKTTIIEALLNACTGSMPPGSGTEKSSFVYDPKVIGETEVKAQIRLIFTGKGAKVMQVIRSFQVTWSRNKTTFATLDNTVAFQDTASGKIISSTYRASDVDRVVPEMLGVSPAVLEHVILCHQEDCNWPLAPPKDVKRIFDDIFAATRYVLALDRLRENSKELRRQQKEHEGSLLALREHRDQARQLEHDIEAKENAVKTIQERSSKLLPELEELRRVSASLEEVEHNIDGLRWESALIQGRIDERHDAIRRANLPPSTKSLEEMVQLKREFTQQIAKSDIEASGKSEQLTAAEQALRKREEEVYTSRPQIHQMEVLDEEHHDMRAKVHKLLELICEGPALRVEDMDVDSLCTAMNDAEYALDAARKEKTTGLSQLEEQLTYAEECLQAHLRLMDIDAKEHEMKENLIAGLMERAKESRDALKVLGDADAHEEMKHTEKDIALLEQRVEAVDALRRKGEHYQQRERLLQELAQQNSRVARLRQEMSRQKQRMDGQTELTVLRQQLKERQSSIKHVMERDILTQLVPLGVVEGDVSTLSLTSVSSKVEHARQQRSLQLAAAQREFSELERTCATLEQKRTTAMEELVRKEENLNRSKLSCQEVIGQQHRLDDFEGMLAEARQRATVLQQRRHSQEALVACYAEFVDVAKRSNVCPVCDRSLEDGSVLQHFIEINEARQKTSPEVVKASVQEATEAMDRLQQLENIQGKVMDVRTLLLRIPDLEESIRILTDELENKKALRDDVASQREDAEGNLQRLNELSRQLSGLLSSHAEAESLSGQLARRENQLRDMVECTSTTDLADGKSFDDLTQEHEEAMSSLHQLNVQLSEVQRMEQDGSQVHVEEQLRVKRNRMYELGLVRSKQEDLMSTIQRYEDDMQGIQASVTVLKSRRVEQKSTLVTLRQNLQEVRAKKLQAEKVLNDRFLNIEDHVHLLATILPKVSDYLRANNVQKLQSAKEDLVRLEEECKQYSAEVTRLKNGIAESRQLVDDQHRRLAEMERIIDVLEAEQSMEYDKGRLREVEQKLYDIQRRKLQGVNPLLGDDACKEPLPRLKERIRTKVSDLERQRSQWEGAIEVMLHDINSLRSQLSRDKYQNIEKRYRSTFLKVQTTEIAVKDIDKYYVALEKAVQSYHQEKIAQINQIIADLWRQTYRGSDIDTVEIRSETETTTTAAARRSYNYRVVMKRGNSEIDMRGRCSAGQKVLASVLIRLALSEAFCCDCGILALDEPTTNLDEDNARSLAEALRVLIETRRFVKHFQLIVITHDEQFVRALGGQSLDTFYYVHKDREGAFSVIEERTFDQLFT